MTPPSSTSANNSDKAGRETSSVIPAALHRKLLLPFFGLRSRGGSSPPVHLEFTARALRILVTSGKLSCVTTNSFCRTIGKELRRATRPYVERDRNDSDAPFLLAPDVSRPERVQQDHCRLSPPAVRDAFASALPASLPAQIFEARRADWRAHRFPRSCPRSIPVVLHLATPPPELACYPWRRLRTLNQTGARVSTRASIF